MPRSNRYILPGCAYHITHRCHDRAFLLRFGVDRTEYVKRLRLALRQFPVSLLCYCITSNHTHLLLTAETPEGISSLMQKLEGEFAEYYNRRKRRSGAFWGDRFHCTMVDSLKYIWNCMLYIELNMVRARAVPHPEKWAWCSYNELVGRRKRYRLIDSAELLLQTGGRSMEAFAANYAEVIRSRVARAELARDAKWTESIAVGSKEFIRRVEENTHWRVSLDVQEEAGGTWMVREARAAYT